MGAKPFIYVVNADVIKEIMVKQFGNFSDKVCIYNKATFTLNNFIEYKKR